MRPFILLLLLLTAPLAAQHTCVIPLHTVGDNASWVFQYDLDHGSTPQMITIDAAATTTSPYGLRMRILDLDEKLTAGSQAEALDTQSGSGTANAQLVTNYRTDVHRILVIVQGVQGGTSAFTGRVDINLGGLAIVNTNQSFKVADGLFIPFGLYASFSGVFATTATYTTSFVVDFGPTPQPLTFRFEGVGTGMLEARLYDVTAGDVLVSTLTATSSGNLDTSDFVTTPSYSGLVEFRAEIQGDGSAGSIFWAAWMPETVSVVSGSGDGVGSSFTGNSKGGGGGGGGCATATGGGYVVMLTLFAAVCVALTRFRRRATRPCRAGLSRGRPGSASLPR
jgi:hypothetical protein